MESETYEVWPCVCGKKHRTRRTVTKHERLAREGLLIDGRSERTFGPKEPMFTEEDYETHTIDELVDIQLQKNREGKEIKEVEESGSSISLLLAGLGLLALIFFLTKNEGVKQKLSSLIESKPEVVDEFLVTFPKHSQSLLEPEHTFLKIGE